MVMLRAKFVVSFVLLFSGTVGAFTLPENFVDEAVIQNLQDPDGFAFSPDGRLFISERISGKLRVATYSAGSDTWVLNATPFHTFDTPKDGNGQPEARRSGGLRDITFDPNFAVNGYVYAFYMHNTTLHNRVVRVTTSSANPDLSDGSELLLIDLPFNATSSSGSHNGGALEFGNDDKLYITTGDGWEGEFAGNPVQSLSTFTGKVLRINSNGVIPTSNPFYTQATGKFRAIYALGLRNPYSMSKHPDSGTLYINEARGNNKASVYIVEASANYQHEGTGIGNTRSIWADASGAGGELITGGAWMPNAGLGNFPASYNGNYFAALWGSNSSSTGRINTVTSEANTATAAFASGIGVVGANSISVKPVITRFASTGELYYLLTTYTTNSAQIRRVRFTAQETVASPEFSPSGGNSTIPIMVSMNSATSGANIHYTLNNTQPTTGSPLYSSPISINESTVLRARGFKALFNTSSEASAVYIIGETENNEPPIVDAGPDKVGFIGQSISLDGSGTTDPDGNDDFLTGEQWTQLNGPTVAIEDASEEIAYFTPTESGSYRFELEVSDGIDTATDEVVISVIEAPRVVNGLQVLYTFEEGSGTLVNDVSGVGSALNLTIANLASVDWLPEGGLELTSNALIGGGIAAKIIAACTASNEISIEAWVEPNSVSQSGPGPVRIVSLSSTTTTRNFTLGQEDDQYDVRLRTTATSNNGTPSLSVPASTAKVELQHILYTRDSAGNVSIYINGVPQVVGSIGGNLSNWDSGYSLILGNEATGDRPWLGKLFLAAVYCQALNSDNVSQNYSAGLPPYSDPVDSDEDGVIDVLDNCPNDPNPNQLNLDGDTAGDECDNDIDNDGVANATDNDANNNAMCRDQDADLCDDCIIGVDGFGPASDATPNNDGADKDKDGLCNKGDLDDDNDTIADNIDNCPLTSNVSQLDSNNNGIGDACDPAEVLCFAISASNGKEATICL
jgi:hypothetical protein